MSRYAKSEKWLDRALKSIPTGTQTFSKSIYQYPRGVSPYFLTKGKGCQVWDVDGNKYVDFINSLAAVTLGYNDSEVTKAVQAQLKEGVIFSLPAPLEVEVAEQLIAMVPCAEAVRFGKNGSDATAGAIRVARAYTGRDHILTCGYHGWQDWYIGGTARHKGVPQAVRALTHSFKYNDLESLHALFNAWPDQVAAVIMEPMNTTEPQPGFLESVKDLAHKHGALLVFDETITGFRYSNGGAGELFNVTPDLATFGKGLANGYPLSAVVGSQKIMHEMEDVFYSFTFGGELLSLAAAQAVLKKLIRKPILKTIHTQGVKAKKGIAKLLATHGASDWLDLAGHPSWIFLLFKDVAPYTQLQLKTLFLQEMFAQGVLTLGTLNMSYAHHDKDIAHFLKALDHTLEVIGQAIKTRSLEKVLRCAPLVPLFKVR